MFAATIALVQTDIKRVLAYSTISQLGYMFVGVGVGAYAAGVFHLVTHAFFKALLFLGAGSVIHGLHGEQDLRNMGGLKSKMLTTTITFLIGALGLAGVPPLAGFFSKDEILAATFFDGQRVLFLILLAGAFLTAFYTFRLVFLAFFGAPRMSQEARRHVHESPAVMTLPLMLLAILTVVAGIALGAPVVARHRLRALPRARPAASPRPTTAPPARCSSSSPSWWRWRASFFAWAGLRAPAGARRGDRRAAQRGSTRCC